MAASARGERRRTEIVDATLALVLEHGFAALTLDDVAKCAGASKSTLMRFFGGRTGLVEAALAREMELVLGPLIDSAGDLEGFGIAFQDVIFSPRCLQLLRFVIGESANDPALGETFRSITLAYLTDLVAPAVAVRVSAAPGSPETTAAVDRFLSDLIGLEILRALSGARPDRERLSSYRVQAQENVARARVTQPMA